MTELEQIQAFERNEIWLAINQRLGELANQSVSQVKVLGKEGNTSEVAWHLGGIFVAELVSELPRIMRERLAKQMETSNA